MNWISKFSPPQQISLNPFASEALAVLDPWIATPHVTSAGRRQSRRWGSWLAASVMAGLVISGDSIVTLAQKPAPPGIVKITKDLPPLMIPNPLPPATSLFVTPDGFDNAAGNFQDLPWLQQAYAQRIQGLARSGRTVPVPQVLPNTSATADRYAPLAIEFATEYRMTRDPFYFNQAKQILEAIAAGFHPKDNYMTDNDGLDFAVYLIHLSYAENVLRMKIAGESSLTDSEHQALVSQLFFPAGQAIQANPYGVDPKGNPALELRHQRSNHRTALDVALLIDGLVIGGRDGRAMVDHAVNSPTGGLLFQLNSSVLPGGLWWENTSAYHIYTLHFITLAALALKNNGMTLGPAQAEHSLQAMMDALVRSANSNYVWPVWGDSRAGLDLPHEEGPFLAIAQMLFPERGIGDAVRRATVPIRVSSWTNLETAIAAMRPRAPSEPPPTPGPTMMPAAGVAFLRSDNTPKFFSAPAGQRYVFFASEPETENAHANGSRNAWSFSVGGADHSSLISGAQNEAGADTLTGREKIFRYRRGLAYPTVVVNGDDQKGSLSYIYPETSGTLTPIDAQSVEGFTSNAYPTAVDYRRQVRLDPTSGYLIDFVSVHTTRGRPETVTLVVHGPPGGTLTGSSPSLKPGDRMTGEVYDPLTDWQTGGDYTGSAEFNWSAPGGFMGSHVEVAATDQSMPVRAAQGPPVDKTNQPVVFLTRTGQTVTFATVYFPVSSDQTAQSANWKVDPLIGQDRAMGVRVQLPNSVRWHIAVLGDPQEAVMTVRDQPGANVTVRGKTADVEINAAEHAITARGQIISFRLPEPKGGITTVTVNGKRVAFQHSGKFIVVQLVSKTAASHALATSL